MDLSVAAPPGLSLPFPRQATVGVSPCVGLTNGQTVTVNYTMYCPGGVGHICEMPSIASGLSRDLPCGPPLRVVATDAVYGSAQLTVYDSLSGPSGPPCGSGGCDIVMMCGDGDIVASVPLVF
jgi:hypothetical protein